MTERNLVDRLLAGQRVPAMSDGLVDRIVTEATRTGRAVSPPPRRRARRWTRRSAWTAAIALNLVLASAVAAAIGGARIVPESVVAATHRMIERIRPHVPLLDPAPRPAPAARHRAAPPRIVRPLAAPRPLAARFAPERQLRPRVLQRVARPHPARVRRFVAAQHRPLHYRAARHWRERLVLRPQHSRRAVRRFDTLPPRWQQPHGWRNPGWTEGRPQRWRPRAWRGGTPRFGRGPRHRR